MRRLLHLLLIPAVVFIVACLDRQLQTDFWVHLARGQLIVQQGKLLETDPFCFASEPMRLVDANWLSQVVFARLFAWGGLNLVQTINAAVLAIAFALLYSLCRKGDRPGQRVLTPTPAAAGACVLVFLGTWQTILIRPQSFSFLLFVLLYTVLCRGTRVARLVATPILMALWCNLHGGYAIGLVLLMAFAISERIEAWAPTQRDVECPSLDGKWTFAAAFVLGLLATLLNPFGWRIYTYAMGVAGRASARHIEEWLPPTLGQFIGIALLLTTVLAIVAMVLQRRRNGSIPIRQIVLMLCFVPLACRSARMAPWWLMVSAPILARWLATLPSIADEHESSRPLRSQIVAGLVCAVLLVAMALSVPSLERYNPLFGTLRSAHRIESDVQAISSRDIGPQGRIYAPLEWSQVLDCTLPADRRLLIDGHIEAFSDPVWRSYCHITSGDSMWAPTVDSFHFRYLLLDRASQGHLIQQVSQSAQWTQRDAAGSAVLFVRNEPVADLDLTDATANSAAPSK